MSAVALHLRPYRVDAGWIEERLVVRDDAERDNRHIDLAAWCRGGHPARLVLECWEKANVEAVTEVWQDAAGWVVMMETTDASGGVDHY